MDVTICGSVGRKILWGKKRWKGISDKTASRSHVVVVKKAL